MWRRSLIVGSYICSGLTLFVLFVYLTFPSQRVRQLLQTTLRQQGLSDISIGSVKPLLPPGLALRQLTVAVESSGQRWELARIPELRIYPHMFVPFWKPLRVGFEGKLYGGHMLGQVTWVQVRDERGLELRADVRDVHLDALPLAAILATPPLQGKLMGTMTLWMPRPRWQESEGRLVFQASAGGLSGIEVMGVRFPALTYDQLGGELALQTRSLVVRELSVRGRDWQLGLRGKVGLNDNFPQSTLELTLGVRSSE
ncbi:MAG: type II secretion system protein GspN, partial [Candidatus Entotheonellia bacterium]